MTAFNTFVRKEFFHILRDRRTMLILFLMPIIQILLFGFAITNEVRNVKVSVFDSVQNIETQRIYEQLNSSEYFILSSIQSEKDIALSFESGKSDLVLVFNPSKNIAGFDVQLITDATEPNQAVSSSYYIFEIIRSRAPTAGMQIVSETKMLYNPQMKSSYNFVPGIMGMILMVICAMMTSVAIVREKETGTMEQLLVSPIHPLSIIFAKLVPFFTLSVINVVTIMSVSVLVIGVPMPSNPLWLALMSILFIAVCLSLGVLVSSIANNQVSATLISGMGFLMPTMILSGMVFPIESMPVFLQWFSCIIPARWFIEAARKLMIQGISGLYVWKEFAVLSGMFLFLIFVSLKRFKVRL
ncbi:MAG: ABC transporter permease [Bacteroidales bacterium]|jgi:ABC-2 type transport system permease protein|nr:ABC transporter permease [Bacteroidales bacterium]